MASLRTQRYALPTLCGFSGRRENLGKDKISQLTHLYYQFSLGYVTMTYTSALISYIVIMKCRSVNVQL